MENKTDFYEPVFMQTTPEWTGNTPDLIENNHNWMSDLMDDSTNWIENTSNNSYSMGNTSRWAENTLQIDVTGNFTVLNVTLSLDVEKTVGFLVANVQLLNAIVLAVAVTLMILFICTFVLKVFSRYHDDDASKEEGETIYYA